MGTRSLTTIRSRWEGDDWANNAVIYRHWDGYLENHGRYLYEFLNGLEVINGVTANPPNRYANGPGRLAAQLVAQMQADGHDPVLYSEVRPLGQEYHYQIDVDFGPDGGAITMTVFGGPMTAFGGGGEKCTDEIFRGTVHEYGEFLAEQQAAA